VRTADRGGAPGLAASPATAQDPPARSRLGLALGGGSARGLAHIGVLRWFEEHRIPIDVVVGTSMGGLVGGGWASGMDSAEIEALMAGTDWDRMFLAQAPFEAKTFRRKQDARAFPSQRVFGLKRGLRLPSGLNSGQFVQLLLDRMALPYGDLESFDDLPTPFRCVAADLNTSTVVVLDSGSLAWAVRATMSLPGVLSPVVGDGRVLVDGGILDNVPADVVRSLGATVVVAVDVAADFARPEPPDTIFGVLGGSLDTMMIAATRETLKAADLVIDPDVTGFGSLDWRLSAELITRGYQAADVLAEELAPYQVTEAKYDAWKAERAQRRRAAPSALAFVRVEGVPERDAEQVRRRFATDLVGRPLDSRADRPSTAGRARGSGSASPSGSSWKPWSAPCRRPGPSMPTATGGSTCRSARFCDDRRNFGLPLVYAQRPIMSAITLLFLALAMFGALYVSTWVAALWAARRDGPRDDEVGSLALPSRLETGVGFVTNFFDTLGIGSFAPTTSFYKLKRMVPDRLIPGTLNVGHTLPVIAQAFIFIAIVEVDTATLALLISASVLGAWLGAGIVSGWSKRKVQIGMGSALLAAATLMLMTQLDLFPSGGDALALAGWKLGVGIAGSFMLGALMTLGIGMYAPCMIMIALLGMNPKAAFPIMMGACAFLMPVGSIRFIRMRAYRLRPSLGLALGGVPAVLIAAYLVGSLPLYAVRWLVVVVVVYTAVAMLRSAFVERAVAVPTAVEAVADPAGPAS